MFRRYGQLLALVFLGVDLFITSAAWFVAYYARFAIWPSPKGAPPLAMLLSAWPVVLMLAAVSYRLCGLYQVQRLRALPKELGMLCRASGLLFLLLIAVVFYHQEMFESRLTLAIFLALNAAGLTIARRLVWKGITAARRRGLNSGRALIVGAGRTGRLVARTLAKNDWTGLEIIGFVDRPAKVEPALLPRLGDICDLQRIVSERDVEHVFVALPMTRYSELHDVYRALGDVLVEVHWAPDLPNLAGLRARAVEIDHVGFLNLRSNPHIGWARIAKRAVDIVGGLVGLLLLGPVMLVIAAIVKLTSPGPVLYRQPRMGLGGKSFDMLKFRSMRIDAEHKLGPTWAKRHDPRCTTVGSILRKWSLDELPQFVNVLKGDMSLVGPRPERAVFIEKFRQQMPSYWQRHQVKAGITGWAQVNGWRGDTSARRRLEFDLWYIANWSIWLDLQILGMTLWRGFRHRNAY